METQEKLKIISTLTGGVVHDINNVLTTIVGYTDILLSNDSCTNCRNEIEIIKKIALDGAEIAKRVKEFVKDKQEGKKVFNISETIKTSIMITKPLWCNQAQLNDKNIIVNYNEKSPIFAFGNESELREALVNIILNSIDAISKDGYIEIAVSRDEKCAVISLRDNGIGMSEEIKNKIFTPFFTTKKENGSGLGLSTAYKAITDMDGKIEVESMVDRGTEFKIFLPATDEIKEEKICDKKIFHNYNPNILIIDDQLEICSVVKEMLTRVVEGKIETCTKGKDALKLLEANNYDIVITDIAMPDINGSTLIKYIKTMKPGTKVIAMTGWNGYIDRENENKPDYILSKPFTIQELEAGINSVYELNNNIVV